MSKVLNSIHSELENLGEKIRDYNYSMNNAETVEEQNKIRKEIKKLEKRKEIKERLYNELL